MKKALLLALFLSSCFRSNDSGVVGQGSIKRQKYKIAQLAKKLETAETLEKKAQEEVLRLRTEMDETELNLIRSIIDRYEAKQEREPSSFLAEREALYRMIESGPSPLAFDAQVQLDRILRLITEISEQLTQ